jgi:hypothetical protein
MAKQHLPGYINAVKVDNTPTWGYMGWVPVLLPYLGRMDLWEGSTGVNGWRTGNPAAAVQVHLNEVVCPDDPNATATTPLSYSVNIGTNTPGASTDLFRDNYTSWINTTNNIITPTNTVSISSVKTPSRTVMLMDTVQATTTGIGADWIRAAHASTPPTPDAGLAPQYPYNVGFCWPLATNTTMLISRLNQYQHVVHVGIVVVTFCDGHTEMLPDGTLCNNDPTNPIFGLLP